MFKEEDVEFILETAERDLANINGNIESETHHLARIGKRMADMIEQRTKIRSIISAIKSEKDG